MQLEQWSHYWNTGSLTSLPHDFSENYDGNIKSHWFECLERLPDNAMVLDVCTGNGAVAVLVKQFSNENNLNFQVHATDGASINVEKLSQRYPKLASVFKSISFHSGKIFEEVALESNSFDLLTSQYGLEYTDWNASAVNANRLLKRGGQLCLICHSPSTDITKYMKHERHEYEYLYNLGVFSDIKTYLNNGIKFSVFLGKAKKNKKKLKTHFQFKKSPLIKGILDFYSHTFTSNEFQFESEKHILNNFYLNHIHAFKRLSDILTVSEYIANNPCWYNAFIENNMELLFSKNIYQNDQHLAGIAYSFQKN